MANRDQHGPFTSLSDLTGRVPMDTPQVEALATAGAFASLQLSRREALWRAGAASQHRPGRLDVVRDLSAPELPGMTPHELVTADLWATGVSDDYPISLVRGRLDRRGVRTASSLRDVADHTRVIIAGVVTHRQRPPTAGGITFLSLEDETGLLNVVVPGPVWKRHQYIARNAGALLIRGMLERSGAGDDGQGGAVNVVAEHMERLPLGACTTSRDFR